MIDGLIIGLHFATQEHADRYSAWRERYITRLMQRGGLSRGEAVANYEAMSGSTGEDALWSLDDDPEDAADEEMSNWTDDEVTT